MKTKSTHRDGFSLLEVSVVLLIIGLVMATSLTMQRWSTHEKRQDKLNKQFERIDEAILAYYRHHGMLPCPARREQPEGTAAFGEATDCNMAAPTDVISISGDSIRVGALPIKALNISPEFMIDPWGNRITYAVAKTLATAPFNAGNIGSITTNEIKLVDGGGNQISRADAVVAFVAISHGKKGSGAVTRAGTVISCEAGTLEEENCNHDDIFRDTFYNPKNTSYYDDKLLWRTARQIIQAVR